MSYGSIALFSRECSSVSHALRLHTAIATAYSGNVRYVVLSAPSSGDEAFLQISQIVVSTVNEHNVALNKPCTSSSNYGPDSDCSLTVDGNMFQRAYPGGYHSANPKGDWVKIDLLGDYEITSVVYYNRKV